MSIDAQALPGTEPLRMEGDLAAEMVAGLDRYLAAETDASVERRAALWGGREAGGLPRAAGRRHLEARSAIPDACESG